MAVSLRDDFDGNELRVLAKRSSDGPRARRLLALAAIYDGMDRTEAAATGLMNRQTLCDWVVPTGSTGSIRKGQRVWQTARTEAASSTRSRWPSLDRWSQPAPILKRLLVRHDLSESGHRSRIDDAKGRYPSHAVSPRRNQPPRRARCPCRRADGSSGMAHHCKTQSA